MLVTTLIGPWKFPLLFCIYHHVRGNRKWILEKVKSFILIYYKSDSPRNVLSWNIVYIWLYISETWMMSIYLERSRERNREERKTNGGREDIRKYWAGLKACYWCHNTYICLSLSLIIFLDANKIFLNHIIAMMAWLICGEMYLHAS